MTSGQGPRTRQWFNIARLWPEARWLAVVAVTYWIAVRVSYLFVVRPEGLASIWPASGLALAILLLGERRRWARLLCAIFITDIAAELVGGNQLSVSFGFALADTLGPAVGAWLITYFVGPYITFTNLKEALALCGVAVLSSGVTAPLDAAVSALAFGAPFWRAWLVWWLAAALGIVLMTPILVSSAARQHVLRATPPRRLVEWILLLTALSALAALIYGPFTNSDRPQLYNYMIFPLLIWAGLRYSPRSAMVTLLPLAAIAVWGTTRGYGIFGLTGLPLRSRMLYVQSFLSVAAFSEMVLAAVVAERRQAAQVANEREHNLRIQRDLGAALNTTGNLADALSRVLEAIRQVETIDCGGVYLVDNPGGDLQLVAHAGLQPQFVERTSHFAADAPQARLALQGEPIYRRHSEITPQMNGARRDEGLRAMGVIPVKHEGQIIAVLNLASHTDDEIPANTRDMLETIAAQVGGAIARIRAESQKEAALKALQASEKRFRALVENSADAITMIAADGAVIYEAPNIPRITGYTIEERLGKSGFETVFPEDWPIVQAALAQMVASPGSVVQNIQFRAVRKDGTLWWAEATATNLLHEPSVCALVINYRDITDRKRAESQKEAALEALRNNMEQLKMTQAQLVQAAKLAAVGELAAGVAHELNNPLTSVLGYAELLLRNLPPDIPFRGDLETIDKQAMRARDIVRNLLDFARQSKPERQPSDLNQVVQQTLGLIRQHLETSGVMIEERYAPQLEPIALNSGQMKQVFLNLINNAAQAMPHGGKLRVSTERVGDEVLVMVADTGIGIPPDILDRIFDPFFTTKPVGQGTGLGLSVSLGIVQEHGGHITVESRVKSPDPDGSPGGSTFSIWLPLNTKEKTA